MVYNQCFKTALFFLNNSATLLQISTNARPEAAMKTLTAQTLWARIAAPVKVVTMEMAKHATSTVSIKL